MVILVSVWWQWDESGREEVHQFGVSLASYSVESILKMDCSKILFNLRLVLLDYVSYPRAMAHS